LGKAAKEAHQMRQNWLGAEHYLLAVLAEPGVATEVMADLDVTHEGVAGQLARINTFKGRRIRYLESKGISTNPRTRREWLGNRIRRGGGAKSSESGRLAAGHAV